MLALTRGRLRWQQALLLFAVGGIVAYFSLHGLTRGMWGGSSASDFQGLFAIVFFVSATAFLSGIVLLVAIAVKALASSTGSAPRAILESPAVAGVVPSRTDPRFFKDASVKGVAMPSGLSTALMWLRIAIVAVIALAVIDLLRSGGPLLSSRHGRYYLLRAVLTLLLSHLPFVVALIRIRSVADGAGLGLAMVAGAVQALTALPLSRTCDTTQFHWTAGHGCTSCWVPLWRY